MDVKEKLMEIVKKAAYSSLPSNTEDFHLNMFVMNLLSNGVTVQEWISVNDRMPEDDLPKDTKKKMIRCLVYTNKGTIKPCVRQRWEVNGKLVPWQWNKDLFSKPTHWMYYPQPPKGE